MTALLWIAGIIGAVLVCAGAGVLFVRWIFDSDLDGKEIDK